MPCPNKAAQSPMSTNRYFLPQVLENQMNNSQPDTLFASIIGETIHSALTASPPYEEGKSIAKPKDPSASLLFEE